MECRQEPFDAKRHSELVFIVLMLNRIHFFESTVVFFYFFFKLNGFLVLKG